MLDGIQNQPQISTPEDEKGPQFESLDHLFTHDDSADSAERDQRYFLNTLFAAHIINPRKSNNIINETSSYLNRGIQ
jgi:hypothetical protein